MVVLTLDNGNKIKLKGREYTSGPTIKYIKAPLKRGLSTEEVKIDLIMVTTILDNSDLEKCLVEEYTFGVIIEYTKANSLMEISKATENGNVKYNPNKRHIKGSF